MSGWQKLPAFTGVVNHGCLNCSQVQHKADLNMYIAVGFGTAQITKDGKVDFDEQWSPEFHYLHEFEARAKKDPGHDWRAVIVAPLHEETYQRQGDDLWVLVYSGMGFA